MPKVDVPRAQKDAGEILLKAYKDASEQKHVGVPVQDWYQGNAGASGSALMLGAQNLGYTVTSTGGQSTAFTANTLNIR